MNTPNDVMNQIATYQASCTTSVEGSIIEKFIFDYGQEVRNNALEESAVIADNEIAVPGSIDRGNTDIVIYGVAGSIAKKIRGLKSCNVTT